MLGREPWNKGTTGLYSDEYKQKLRQAKLGTSFHLGHKHSDETKAIIKEKRKYQIFTDDTKKKLSASAKNRPKKNMSIL